VLPKIEFGQLYKFIMSVGLVLLASAVALPWLVLQHSDVLLIHADELKELTPTARAVLIRKQRDSAWVTNNYWWMAFALAGVGVVMIAYGFWQWRRRQRVLDEIEDTQLTTDKQRLRQMSPEAVDDRQEREAVEAVVEEPGVEAPAVSQAWSPDRLARSKVASARSAFVAVERLLARRFDESFASTHRLFTNIELSPPARSREVDIFAFASDAGPSFVVEVKYSASGRVEPTRLVQAVHFAGDGAKAFTAQFGQDVRALVLFVVEEPRVGTEMTVRISGIVQGLRDVVDARFGVLLLSRTALDKVPASEFRQLVLRAIDGELVARLDDAVDDQDESA
jgi:hypothetical protein